MRISPPDDWDGESWECVQLYWPSSDKWLAILAGLITTPTRGRFWDERHGSIVDTQAIGLEIDARNLPFNSCEGRVIEYSTEYIRQFISAEESDFLMSLCGYNPKAFKIENGTLYVRDFCGDWVAIGALDATPDLPPETSIPDPPPDGLLDSTPCAMAQKLAVFTYNIMVQAFSSINGADPLYGILDFYDELNSAFTGVDLAFNDVANLFYEVWALNAAGLQSETLDTDVIQWLACYWSPLIPSSNTGVDSSTYNELRDVTDSALQEAIGNSAYYGFGRTMCDAWERAFKSIGAKDVQKLTYYVQPTGLESCDCPSESFPTEPTASGWYFGPVQPAITFSVPEAGETIFGYGRFAIVADHDLYGLQFSVEKVSGDNPNKVSRNAQTTEPYDVNWFNPNSDSLSLNQIYVQAGGGVYAELYPGSPSGYTNLTDGGGNYSNVPSSPTVDQGEVARGRMLVRIDSGSGVYRVTNLRYIYNINSPSHS